LVRHDQRFPHHGRTNGAFTRRAIGVDPHRAKADVVDEHVRVSGPFSGTAAWHISDAVVAA